MTGCIRNLCCLFRLRSLGQPFLAYHPGLLRETLAYNGCAELFQVCCVSLPYQYSLKYCSTYTVYKSFCGTPLLVFFSLVGTLETCNISVGRHCLSLRLPLRFFFSLCLFC